MNHIKILTHENIPCWYELSWVKASESLIFRIHKEFIQYKPIDFKSAPIVKHYIKEYSLPPFEFDFNKDIGFGGIIKFKQEKDNFIEYHITIPQVKKYTGKKCKECDGKGYDEERDMKCLHCENGKVWTMDWKEINLISASLSVLTTWLHFSEKDVSCPYSQLATIDTVFQPGMHGGSLSGDCSIDFKNKLKTLGDIYLNEISDVTKLVYTKLFGIQNYLSHYDTRISNGRFTINCPGDACGLYPSEWYDFKDEGFKFSCHNVDSPAQQLTLLVGFAVLCDKVRSMK